MTVIGLYLRILLTEFAASKKIVELSLYLCLFACLVGFNLGTRAVVG